MKTRADVLTRIGYVERNPEKEALAPQAYPFVVPCNLR
jgi:hypothetical protein